MTKTPMIESYTFEITLNVAEQVNSNAGELLETVVNAIYDYDFQCRLFPGRPKKWGDERLLGSATKLIRYSREVDETARILEQMAASDSTEFNNRFPYWDAAPEICSKASDVTTRLHHQREDLVVIMAKLDSALDGARMADNEKTFKKELAKLKRALSVAEKVTKGITPVLGGGNRD